MSLVFAEMVIEQRELQGGGGEGGGGQTPHS